MTEFKKYQHIENNLNSPVCNGLLYGTVLTQPKLDGCNCQVWLEDGKVTVSSRNKVLSLESDNQSCYYHLSRDQNILNYLTKYPNHKLCGEWLVPHHIKYIDSAWKQFYVFDIIDMAIESVNGNMKYLNYSDKYTALDLHGINILPFSLIAGTVEDITNHISNTDGMFNNFLLSEGQTGEGIVIKIIII